MTSQQYQMSLFEESDVWTLSVEDFRARLSRLQEVDEVLKIHEELCFLKLHGSHLFSDLNIYSLRTLKDSSTMTEELHLRPSSEPWMSWGMMWNGKCLTARILESPKIGNVCSLSDILEENVPEEFFLSQALADKLINIKNSQQIHLQPDIKTVKGVGSYIIESESQRVRSDGEPMFTLTAQDKHGILIAGKLPGNHDQNSRVYDTDGLAPTLSTMQGGGQEPKIIQRGQGYRIRKLTPRECWRLQGFPDWAFDKAQEVNSNSQLYKQAGNSVTVNVIAAIAKELK